MPRRFGRRTVFVGAAAITMTLMAVAPSPAAPEDPFSVPPQVPVGTPPSGRYVDPTFEFAKTRADVPYGQAVNSRGEQQTLLLDVYEPSGDTEAFRPVVVWVHGGYFKRGSKADVDFLHELTRRGYVTVAINYRLRPELPEGLGGIVTSSDPVFNAQYFIDAVRDAQHDAMAAVRWVRANAADLRADASRVVVGGHSAGGLTTMNVVFNADDPGDSGNPGWSSDVAAGLSSAGAYGPGLSGDPAQPGNSPLFVMHGTNDTVVPQVGSILPCTNTLAVGNVCEQRIYPGAGHGLPDADQGPSSAEFLYRHVINAPRTATTFESVTTSTQGETVTVGGRLVRDGGAPVAGARVLARATAGWVVATTGPDGGFSLSVPAPDHGQATDVLLRYDGSFGGSGLLAESLAPTDATTIARWGRA